MKTFYILASLFFGAALCAEEVGVSDPESARKAVLAAKPGDVVVLAEGEWKDADLRFDGEGTADQPIMIRAEEPGKTVITGASRVRLGGTHLVVSGLFLMNLSGANADWLEFRIDSKRRANFCRVTDCQFVEGAEFEAKEENRWIGVYGEGNQLDRCTISGKKGKGSTVVIWLGEEDKGRHRIQANFFGPRPRLGQNGGETIRVGDSRTSTIRAECLVEGNYFMQCDGEVECVSNKSSGNLYRGNWFNDSQGTLTLRHGDDCLVERNIFTGGRRGQTGGVRVIGKGHRIIGNYFSHLEGDGFRSALCLVNGIPDSPANGYHQVVDAEIRANFFEGCKESILIGYNDEKKATLPPRRILFEGNRMIADPDRAVVRVGLDPVETTWTGNLYLEGALIGIKANEGLKKGFFETTPPFPSLPDTQKPGVTWLPKQP